MTSSFISFKLTDLQGSFTSKTRSGKTRASVTTPKGLFAFLRLADTLLLRIYEFESKQPFGNFMRLVIIAVFACLSALPMRAAEILPHPILFVTQTPSPSDFTTVAALFGNHR